MLLYSRFPHALVLGLLLVSGLACAGSGGIAPEDRPIANLELTPPYPLLTDTITIDSQSSLYPSNEVHTRVSIFPILSGTGGSRVRGPAVLADRGIDNGGSTNMSGLAPGRYEAELKITDRTMVPMTLDSDFVEFVVSDCGAPGPSPSATPLTRLRSDDPRVLIPLANAVQGEPYDYTIPLFGGTAPLSAALIGGALPAGLTLESSGRVHGNVPIDSSIPADAPFLAGVRVTDSCSVPRFFDFDIRMTLRGPGAPACDPLSLSATNPPAGRIGVSYAINLNAIGGELPVTFQIDSGTLPPGLALNGSQISGAPTTYGTSNITLRATDSCVGGAQSVTQNYALHIGCATLAFDDSSLSNGEVGIPYSDGRVATGGEPPYIYALSSGTLPPGISLVPGTGQLQGTPTTAGTYVVTLEVTDSCPDGGQIDTAQITVVIDPADACPVDCPEGILPVQTVQTAYVGLPFEYQFFAPKGEWPDSLEIVSTGGLNGVFFDPGALAFAEHLRMFGTPTVAGNFMVRVHLVSNCEGAGPAGPTVDVPVTVLPNPGTNPVIFNGPRLTPGQVGVAYDEPFAYVGGVGGRAVSLVSGTLPPGLTLTNLGVTGTPTQAGEYLVVLEVADVSVPPSTSTRSFGIRITDPAECAPLIINGEPHHPQRGVAYIDHTFASGGVPPYTVRVVDPGNLPPGMAVVGNQLGGTPTQLGTYDFRVAICDACPSRGPRYERIHLEIADSLVCDPIGVGSASYFPATVNEHFSQAIPIRDVHAPYTFQLESGTLPPGLTLNGNVLSGIPTAAGNYTFQVKVEDTCLGPVRTATGSVSVRVYD